MKLVKVADKVHIASRQGGVFAGFKVPTPACNPKHLFFVADAGAWEEYEGESHQVTCVKCLKKLGLK